MMRHGAQTFLLGALMGTAWVGPLLPASAQSPVETAYASDRESVATDEAAPSIRSIEPSAAEDDRGNPLWAVPLTALAATRERPLFSSSRRPPPPAAPPAVVEAPPPPPPTPSAPAQPPFLLIGAIISPQAQVALIKDAATQTILRVRAGDEPDGWRVRSVAARSIVVEKADQSFTLDIPRVPDQAAPPPRIPPDQNPPPPPPPP